MSQIDEFMQRIRRLPVEDRASELTKLLDLASSDELRHEALVACLNLCNEGVLRKQHIEAHAPTILEYWRDVFKRADPMQGPADKLEWKIDGDYSEVRLAAGLLLDLMGYLPIQQVESALREGLSLTDQRLKMFAALSLLRQLQVVEPEELEKIAASHEVRILLWEQLRLQNMESLMPEAWSSPEMLAASVLSRWVAHPMELGTPPEEIELMGTFPAMTDTGVADIYLFRFREYPQPWEPGQGWKAGIAGPMSNGEAIGSSWSRFENWDSRTPEEHFAKLYESISGGD
jgi:hypothetical protein